MVVRNGLYQSIEVSSIMEVELQGMLFSLGLFWNSYNYQWWHLVSTSEWTHVAITHNGPNVYMYINGVVKLQLELR
jgi:hypothetical protein